MQSRMLPRLCWICHPGSLMDDDEALEPEILTYQEFKKQQTLLAWRRRWRTHELQQDEARPWAGAAPRALREREQLGGAS
jgi:hypothetical protein